MALNKKRILPDEYVVKQGDEGSTAFLIISGALNVEIDGKKLEKWNQARFLENYPLF